MGNLRYWLAWECQPYRTATGRNGRRGIEPPSHKATEPRECPPLQHGPNPALAYREAT